MRVSATVQLTMSFTALRRHAALRGNVERQQGNEQKGMDILSNNKKLIALIGATGQQGGGVVRALHSKAHMASFWSPIFGKRVPTSSSRQRRRYALPRMPVSNTLSGPRCLM